MKYILRVAMLALICPTVLPPAGRAESLAVRNCTWCHGSASAQGYTPAPRLAGQRAAYMETELLSFAAHRRDTPFARQYMWGAAGNLSRDAMRDLASYFSTLPPRAANDGDRELTAVGRRIYQEGIPEQNVVACVACHGPNAEGVREIPRMGGLAYTYLKRRLKQWAEGYNQTVTPPMPHIAATLSLDQIEALTSYLSFISYTPLADRFAH